ncbi:MAG: FAD-binding oxidoreductase, partial [Clostridia bacterium]|nr:FAD-binding oxidoreductase [Clostridia bacterium]
MGSLWNESVSLPRFEQLNQDAVTDVLIIGGGIAGILTAYLLDKQGIDYMLVEKDRICAETTGNTTAKITSQHGLIYHEILKRYGVETASEYLRANNAALSRYAKLCASIECDYEIKDNYVYTIDDRRALEDEMTALQKIGYEAEFCEKISLPLKTAGAVKFAGQAQFHPLKFINSICKDLKIYENTFVIEMINNTAKTENCTVKAENVVVTTHFPFINKHGLYPLKLFQHRSYVIALENAVCVNGMYVDDSDTGMSF